MSTPQEKLLYWYDQHGRDLPWRRTRDPYKILVSEIMLQQTQVPRVLLFYKRWLKQFPNWRSLAKTSKANVIRAWAGLGYNRRALMLRNIAREIVKRGVPRTEAEWRGLKGVGPYTAAALAAFSLRKRTMPIDTNIRRVLYRYLFGIPFPNVTKQKVTKFRGPEKNSFLEFLPKKKRWYDIPQALFDLAALVCKKVPDCASCPLRRECKAAPKFLSGRCSTPARMTKTANERRHRNKKYPDRIYRGRILALVRQNPAGTFLRHMTQIQDIAFEPKYDRAWLASMIKRLIKDGLIARHGDRFTLP